MAPEEEGTVGTEEHNQFSLCNFSSSWVTAVPEKLIIKPLGFKILLIYFMLVSFLHFVFMLVSEGQGCQFPFCSQLYSLKMFNFYNAADRATEFVVFHTNYVQIYPVFITVTFLAAGFAWGSSRRLSLCKAAWGHARLPSHRGWAWRSLDLLCPSSSSSQFSQVFLASLAGKNVLCAPCHSCFYPASAASRKCHGGYTQGYLSGCAVSKAAELSRV